MTRNLLFVDCSLAHGGAQRSLYSLISTIDRDRYVPHLLCGNDSAQGLLKQCRRQEIHSGFISIRSWRRNVQGLHHAVVDLIKAKPVLRRWIEKYKIDVVHANGVQSALLCAMTMPDDVPLVFHCRDHRAPRTAMKKVLGKATCTIMVSDFLRDYWGEQFPEFLPRMKRIYNGFNFEQMEKLRHAYDYREQRGWKEGTFAISVLADLMPWKRQDLFIEAFAKVHQACPDSFAFVIGGIRDEKAADFEQGLIEQVRGLGLTQAVAFTGHVENPFPLIDASDVIVSVAENEPFGRNIVESLYCGKPIVVSEGGGPAEIGRCCDAVIEVPAEPEQLAAAILALRGVDANARAAMARNAEACARRYDMQSHVNEVTALLDECLPCS